MRCNAQPMVTPGEAPKRYEKGKQFRGCNAVTRVTPCPPCARGGAGDALGDQCEADHALGAVSALSCLRRKHLLHPLHRYIAEITGDFCNATCNATIGAALHRSEPEGLSARRITARVRLPSQAPQSPQRPLCPRSAQ